MLPVEYKSLPRREEYCFVKVSVMKPKGLILFHGAGGNRDHGTFLDIERLIDIPILRYNFAYREANAKRPPPRADRLIEEVGEVAASFAEKLSVPQSSLVIGGRSMGGRVASMAVANGLPARGLVLLSYPFHPPGKPESLRVNHLHRIRRPTILISGDRDPFGSPQLLRHYAKWISSEVSIHILDGQNHNPKDTSKIIGPLFKWLYSLR